MSWFEEAKKKRENNPSYGYGRIAKEYGLTWDTVRDRFRRERGKETAEEIGTTESSLTADVYNLIKDGKKHDINLLCDRFKVNPKILSATFETLQEDGYQVLTEEGEVYLCKIVVPAENIHAHPWDGNKVIRFGVTTDLHTGSTHQQYTHIHNFYDLCQDEGISRMFHVGDITDGVNMRVGHSFECVLSGADRQVNYVINNFPFRKGMETEFIGGNHDASSIKSTGYDIGNTIARERADMKYLGCLNARVMLTPKCSVQLSHPIDGSCFDDQTEIMTKDGWKFFNELTKDDIVATMTKGTHEFQWQNPSEVTVIPYKGDMYTFKSRTVDLCVTPNHGMWTRENPINTNRKTELTCANKSHFRRNTEWRRETAEYVANNYGYRQRWQFTNCCEQWKGEVVSDTVTVPFIESKNIGMKSKMKHIGDIQLKDFCELVAWYVTEGNCRKSLVNISQYRDVNPANHSQIVELFRRIGFEPSVGEKFIRLGSKELSSFLVAQCGHLSRHKYLPSFVKELPSEYLQIVFDTMVKGDGWIANKGFGYRSISPRLVSDFMEIAVKLGYAVCSKGEVVHVTLLQKYPTVNKPPEVTQYDGYVYCCKVPNELIFVRRNGKCTWSHNSYALSYKLQRALDAMSGGSKPNILLVGHYHKAFYMLYRNVHALTAGCFQAQTPWMEGKQIAAMMGGWIITAHVNDAGQITRFAPEFVPFYDFIPNDYV